LVPDERHRIQDLEGRLAAAPPTGLGPEELGDLETLADLYLRADSYLPALETLEHVLSLEELRDPADTRRLAVECKAVECLRRQGRFGEAAARAQRSLLHATSISAPGICARLKLELIDALTQLSRYDEARGHAQETLDLVRRIGDKGLLASALGRAGILWMRLGDWLLARDLLEEARTLFQGLGEEPQVANVEASLGIVHKNLCEWAIATHYLRQALSRDRRLGRFAQVANRLQNLGIVYLKSGEWTKAHEAFIEARQIFHQVGNQWGLTTTALSLGIHCRLVGLYDESKKLLGEGLERALGAGLLREEALAREFLGDLALDQDETERALEHYRACLALAERTAPAGDVVSEVLRRLAEVHLRRGDLEAAQEAVDRCRKVCDLLDDRYEGAILHRVAGSLLLRQGERESAIREWRTAVNLLGEMGERFERGRALFLLAQHATEPAEARKLGYRASACFAEVGAERALDEVEQWIADRVSEVLSNSPADGRRPRLSSRRRAESMGMIGVSRGLSRALDLVERAAASDLTVLITGESGTGKELIARGIHEKSNRNDRPFLPVNCGALRADLALSQLFGHRRGAYTGAHTEGLGLVEAAHTGTLFLDEVGELPLDVQVTLLRFLERGDYLRLGETSLRHADVRIIAATHVDLRQAITLKNFRTDLFYRLNEIEVHLPPLAERIEDVLPLVHHFLQIYEPTHPIAVTPDAATLLTAYPWPGNVRELENCVKRILALRRDPVGDLTADELLPHLGQLEPRQIAPSSAPGERAEIVNALERSRGNKSAAAGILGVSRKTLYSRMRRLGIPLDAPAGSEAEQN
jgi:DNA-binding NtrC family response regulator/tetratricopeptide (TPR) repeat protein